MAIGKDKKTIAVTVHVDQAAELERRAESLYIPTSDYCRRVLQEWLDNPGNRMEISEA